MSNPFDLSDNGAYLRWHERKLAQAIADPGELIVEIANPAALTVTERGELLARCRRSNMAIYATAAAMDEQSVQQLGAQLGLQRLDANWLAGEQGVSRIAVHPGDGVRQAYIPYTDRAIKWHTDGYYNPPERQIRGMILHCVRPAAQSGENRLLGGDIRECKQRFIEQLNKQADGYADFDYGEDGPSFNFTRYLGYCMDGIMDAKDSGWIIDQMITVEAPDAAETIEKTMRNLLETEPRQARRRSGTSGD